MSGSKKEYSDLMKHLSASMRRNVMDILNSLIEEGYEEEPAIAIAVDTINNQMKSAAGGEENGIEYYVLPHPRGWAVRKVGGQKASYVYARKEEAVEKAIDLVKEKGGRLVIYKEDGTVQANRDY
ncbi:DUF2188 domain-containing protein [Legionella nagasakiensis]|uniref:DUF2188 domain-containing protein n=1 Tax=Legionella nagasakiensis TaxID=535290 RepID=UPI0010557C0E|nr:DUF2188 domain-containing protein [Legionella nagasakiensis]